MSTPHTAGTTTHAATYSQLDIGRLVLAMPARVEPVRRHAAGAAPMTTDFVVRRSAPQGFARRFRARGAPACVAASTLL